MRIVKFDLNTYNMTKDLPGGPTYVMVEEDIPEIQMIRNEHGQATRGGLIGYVLAYVLMAGFVGAMFLIL